MHLIPGWEIRRRVVCVGVCAGFEYTRDERTWEESKRLMCDKGFD